MRPSTLRLRRGLLDLAHALYRGRVPLGDMRLLPLGTAIAPAETPIPPADVAGWRPIDVGDRWGGADENAWFHAEARVPASWIERLSDNHAVVLRWLLGVGREDNFGWPEGLLYVRGRLQQGINRHHPDVLLRDEDVRAGHIAFDVRAWSGMLASDHRIEYAEIALLDRRVEALYTLLAEGADVVDALPADGALAPALAAALYDAYDAVRLQEVETADFERQVEHALTALRTRLAELRARYDASARPVVTAIGHGHLDVAWLWQTRHTREKAARTFGIATALMDRYPEYVFLHTTPQVFAWLEADYPELFTRVRERVSEGRFEAGGAMWLESDCNLVSGESLVRQIVYGQRYLRETFGREYDALWLPDAFGYTAALPQILLRAGIPLFMTTKMSWSDTNRIPADTFRWRGLDGSEILAHFITTPSLSLNPLFAKMDTYNGAMSVAAMMGLWERYRQKDMNEEVLLSYGYGDGGAGPTRQHLEAARALRELPGLPELRLGRADEYFHRLRERVWHNPSLPTWDGELYLEYHRGTYTTQAELKRAHRQNEARLLLAEALDAWQWMLMPGATRDRRHALDDAWRTLLLHEFHDILPGSSIGPVYADARIAMSELAEMLEALIAEAASAIAAHITGVGASQVVLNPSPCTQAGLLEAPMPAHGERYVAQYEGGEQVALDAQATIRGDGVLLEAPEVPGRTMLAIRTMHSDASPEHRRHVSEPARAGDRWLENAFFRLEFDGRGDIRSFVDKRIESGRELVAPGQAFNRLQAFDDRPANFDAWDIDQGYEAKPLPVSDSEIVVEETGPLRATLRVIRTVGASTITQRVSLYRRTPRVDFRTTLDWHEQHVLLKAAFPLDLRSRTATSSVQFGAVERSTHRNTSWDAAQFETVAHQWVDLSEGNYGVSLLNDGRYGHDVRDNVIRISLLRSPTRPDPHADQGEHEVTYSLYPHSGDWRTGGTVEAAYAVNRPLRLVPANGGLPPAGGGDKAWLVRAAPMGVVVESVKRAADGDGVMVRVYESRGNRCSARLEFAGPATSIVECDLLERPLGEGASPAYALWQESCVASHDAPQRDDDGWTFALRPYEIRTFRIR